MEFAAGETKELNVALNPLSVGLFIERLFVVGVVLGGDAEEVLFCDILNTGSTQVITEITSHILVFDVFPDPQHKGGTRTITINPGEIARYREFYRWEPGCRVESWITGDAIDESPHMKYRCGYTWPHPGEHGADLDCVDQGSDYALLRYVGYSACNEWDFDYRTPPWGQGSTVERVQFTVRAKGDAVAAHWNSLHCLLHNLLPGRTYEARCDPGGPSYLDSEVIFSL